MFSYRERTPWYHLQGRRHANRSSSLRSATFTLRKPVPMGVVNGPLMATPLARIDSSTGSGPWDEGDTMGHLETPPQNFSRSVATGTDHVTCARQAYRWWEAVHSPSRWRSGRRRQGPGSNHQQG